MSYGNTSGSYDLRFATPAIGGMETSLITLATAASTKHYGITIRSGGSLIDSKTSNMLKRWSSGFEVNDE